MAVNDTVTEMVVAKVMEDPTVAIVLAIIVCLSEIMPLLPIKQNGILHTLVTLFQMVVRKE
jgi:hypothetical protein